MTAAEFLFSGWVWVPAFIAVGLLIAMLAVTRPKFEGLSTLLFFGWFIFVGPIYMGLEDALTDDYESEYWQIYVDGNPDLSSCGESEFYFGFGQTLEEKIADLYAEAAAEASNEIRRECRSKLWDEWRDAKSRHPQAGNDKHRAKVFTWQNNPFTEVR